MTSRTCALLTGAALVGALACERQPAEAPSAPPPPQASERRLQAGIDLDDPVVQEEIRQDLAAALESAPLSGRERRDAPAQHIIGRAIARRQIVKDPIMNAIMQPDQPDETPGIDPRIDHPMRMSDDSRYDDFPDIAADPSDRSSAWVVWQSYADRTDQLRLAAYLPQVGTWSTWNPVPGVTGDVWRPTLAFDGGGLLWVVWSQRVDNDFDLYARAFDGTRWGELHRLTDEPGGDFDQRVARAPDGTLHLVWQAFRSGQSDVLYATWDGTRWSEPLRISESRCNDWAPDVAVGRDGTAQIVWDTYDAGNYDVLLRSVTDGTAGPVRPLADTPRYEAQASVAVDREGRIWVAYDVGPTGWAKDQGRVLPMPTADGTRILDERSLEVVCLDGDRVLAPPQLRLPERRPTARLAGTAPIFRDGRLIADDDGNIHLLFRRYHASGGFADYWMEWLTSLTTEGWSPPALLPYSEGRASMRAAAAAAPDGGLWLAWPRSNRPSTSIFIDTPEERLIENVYTAGFSPAPGLGTPRLAEWTPPQFVTRPDGTDDERRQIEIVRGHAIPYQGRRLQIVRGDLHRHTELSVDLGSVPDGSLLDCYRYMLDAAGMDFGASTDHQAGSDRDLWWWYTQKLTDLFHSADGYQGIFGYERSLGYPWGHRNIFWAERGHKPLPFFQEIQLPFRIHLAATDVQPNDTRLLYEEVRRTGGVSVPHTTATNMGTDWADNDPEVEPLVEIFQGDRFSYEHEGAPWSDPQEPGNKPATEGYREAGFVWRAWEKGYRMGVIASSDHYSTHMSYACLLVPERSRQAIVEAMRARHAYGATDNIVLDVGMGSAIMGDEITSGRVPDLRVRVIGTGELETVDVIRNNRVVFSVQPEGREARFSWRDVKPEPNLDYYYVRVVQADGHLAWSSPIWVNLK